MLATTAQRWSVRPSSLLGPQVRNDSVIALLLDDALHVRLTAAEGERARRSKNKSDGAIAPGTVYESVSDVVH
jgi:hypothetical protein